jgi:YVTN family beta-propeller protein
MRPRSWPAVAAAVILGACSGSPPSSSGASAPVPAAAPVPRVYVSDETGGNVVAVDPVNRQVVQKVAVGKRPRGIRLSPDGTKLYVALSGSPIGGPGVDESKLPPGDRAADGIGVVDVASGTLVRKYQSGQDPETFDVSADGRMLYVSNEETSEMTALDLTSGAIAGHVKVGEEPEGVTVRPDQRLVYVACEGENKVFVVDREKLSVVARIDTPARPRAVAFTRDGSSGFISTENGGALVVFDPATNQVVRTHRFEKDPSNPIPPRPMGLAVTSDGQTLFVSLGRFKAIAEMGVADGSKLRMIADVGARPWGIAVSADDKTLYSANGSSGDVSIVDIASEKVVARIQVGGSPWGVALTSRPSR